MLIFQYSYATSDGFNFLVLFVFHNGKILYNFRWSLNEFVYIVYNEILMTYFAKKRGIFIHKSYNQISEHRLDGS